MKMKTVKFGLLGLGRVVKTRIVKMFKNELKGAKVLSVYDKDKKKRGSWKNIKL